MDIAEYRRQVAEALEGASGPESTLADLLEPASRSGGAPRGGGRPATPGDGTAPEADLAEAFRRVRDRDEPAARRVALLEALGGLLGARTDLIDLAIALLVDRAEPITLRRMALKVLDQASFLSAEFAPRRPDVLGALREVVDDPDAELRRRAIGTLAREKDEYVQRRLMEGLEHPSRALVPAAKAIQFLGYDIHAEHYPMLHRMARRAPTESARREAVRLLGADPAARDLLAELYADRSEKADLRQLAGVALQTLDPDRFEALAREVVLDETEDEGLRASALRALTLFGNPAALGADRALGRAVARMESGAGSRQLRRATQSFRSKYGG
jgi:hypothetical protein